jgi:hypothetical protein
LGRDRSCDKRVNHGQRRARAKPHAIALLLAVGLHFGFPIIIAVIYSFNSFIGRDIYEAIVGVELAFFRVLFEYYVPHVIALVFALTYAYSTREQSLAETVWKFVVAWGTGCFVLYMLYGLIVKLPHEWLVDLLIARR